MPRILAVATVLIATVALGSCADSELITDQVPAPQPSVAALEPEPGDEKAKPVQEPTTTLAVERDVTTTTTSTTPPTTTTTATTTTTTRTLITMPPTTTTTLLPMITAGTYVVGSEVEPGIYRVLLYWARLDDNLDIIDNDVVSNGFSLVRVFESDAYLEISGAAIALADMPGIDPIALDLTDGTYLVGIDVKPGRYRVTSESGRHAIRGPSR